MSTPTRVLDPRTLNRALLDRQMLARRDTRSATSAVEHLVGVHAQIPAGPYIGLCSRLDGFAFAELGALLQNRQLVRTALHRSTIHLVTTEDCLQLRPLVQPVLTRDLLHNATHGPPLRGVDLDEVAAAGRALLDEQPRTPAELGALLQPRWPDLPPASLAYAVRNLAPLIQVPPRGIWGQSGQTRHATVQTWLGRPLHPFPAPEQLIIRYLAAFGPATVPDVQTWSGLTRLHEITERLRGHLIAFHDDHGRELLDLPDAARPEPDTPAPPRLLPEFDNVFLSHADRRRIIPAGLTFAQFTQKWGLRRPRGGMLRGTILLDGFLHGAWRITTDAHSATIAIETFRPLTPNETTDLHHEGARLLTTTSAPIGEQHVHISCHPRPDSRANHSRPRADTAKIARHNI